MAAVVQENEECVASGKSVPSLWEQAAISRQACETFLGRLSRLDRGMEGWEAGGPGAVGSLCLAQPNPTTQTQTPLSLQPPLCQQAGRMPVRQEVYVCVCVTEIILVYV